MLEYSGINYNLVLLKILNAIFILTLFIRELTQALTSPNRYFCVKWKDNFVELALIGLTTTLLFCPSDTCNDQWRRRVAATVIVLSWFEMILII